LHDEKDPSRFLLDQWLLGYVRGATEMRWGIMKFSKLEPWHEPTQPIDNDGLIGWVNNYSRAHPTETIELTAWHMMAPRFNPNEK
jgi:hypothetical protein